MDRYIVKHLIGKGRTGGVYEAEDTTLGTMVAMRRFYDDNGDTDGYRSDASFIDIIQSRTKIQHPNLAKISHGEVDEDGPFIIAELIVGEDLHSFLNKHHYMEAWQGIQLASQILSVFELLHQNSIIHGSLGPSSIIAQPNIDHGLRFVILDTSLNQIVSTLCDDPDIQQRGANIVMRPIELLQHEPASEQTDLYMLGQILYYMLSGAHPFAGFSREELLTALIDGMPPLAKRRPDLDPDFTAWVDWLVNPAPADRPTSASEAKKELDTFASRPSFTLPKAATQSITVKHTTTPSTESPIRTLRALPPLHTPEESNKSQPIMPQPPAIQPDNTLRNIIISIIAILVAVIAFALLLTK